MTLEIDIKGQADRLRGTGSDGGRRFLLSQAEWYHLQAYCAAVLALPADDESIRNRFQLTPGDDAADFADIRDRYASMHGHVAEWNGTVMPRSVEVAEAVRVYGHEAQDTYGELLRLVKERGLEDPTARGRFQEVLDGCIARSRELAAQGGGVAELVRAFQQRAAEDTRLLAPLKEKYEKRYDHEDAEWRAVRDQIADDRAALAEANEEYNRDVVVAATTPAYAWVPFFGFIAAVTVASVYADKAVEARKEIDRIEQKINDEQKKLTRNAHIRRSVLDACESLAGTESHSGTALGTLGAIRSAWESVAAELAALRDLAENDVKKAEEIVDLQIQQAIDDWKAVSAEAADYLDRAYIKPPSAFAPTRS
ncbi:alpha-xenorhabdolysin family binary toxin subunit A [Nocardiopsis sp. CNT-189]|uniref:alpha-xenorhabdolysin family binary toxin subunit A n=1 Tax=Nocardiopsis oceanisediminis TaxID=2816862 RepID=UPI003B399D45